MLLKMVFSDEAVLKIRGGDFLIGDLLVDERIHFAEIVFQNERRKP